MGRKLKFAFLKCISIILLLSCKDKSDIELTVLNKELITYSYGSKKDTINIVSYCLENKSNSKYFILNFGSDTLSVNYNFLRKNGIEFNVFNRKNDKEVDYDNEIFPQTLLDNPFRTDCDIKANKLISQRENLECERLKYNDFWTPFISEKLVQNHFINPGEKIYGRIYLNITDTMKFENGRVNYAKLYHGNNYYAKVSINSDTINYKTKLYPEVLMRIKNNDVKIYHGKILSKNAIPIKVLK
jgi:hypothetical protein